MNYYLVILLIMFSSRLYVAPGALAAMPESPCSIGRIVGRRIDSKNEYSSDESESDKEKMNKTTPTSHKTNIEAINLTSTPPLNLCTEYAIDTQESVFRKICRLFCCCVAQKRRSQEILKSNSEESSI